MDDLTALALQARGGDRSALEAFVRAFQPDVWRFCAYLASPADADDLTQDTFVRAVGALARYRADAPARVWLLAIARHTCADAVRRNSRQPRFVRIDDDSERDSQTTGFELYDLIARLDHDRRLAFVLTQIFGFSYLETAQACGCPVGTVRSRVARARAQLIAEVVGEDRAEGRLAVEP